MEGVILMSVIPPESFVPWGKLEGQEIRKDIEEAKKRGDKKVVKALKKINKIGEMADRSRKKVIR